MRTGFRDGRRDIAQGRQGILADRDEGDGPAVEHHRIHAGHMREAMVERQDDQHDVVLVQGDHGVALGHVGGIVAVGQQDALRIGRRAGRIGDVGVVVRTDRTVTGLEQIPVVPEEPVSHLLDLRHPDLLLFQGFEIKCRIVEDNDLLDSRAFRQDGTDLRQVVAGHQDPFGLRMVDPEYQVLPFPEVHGKRNIGRTGVHGTQFSQDPHRPAFGKQGDFVTFFQAEGHETGADAVSLLPGLFLGDGLPLAADLLAKVDMVGELPGIFFYKINDGCSFCHDKLVLSFVQR